MLYSTNYANSIRNCSISSNIRNHTSYGLCNSTEEHTDERAPRGITDSRRIEGSWSKGRPTKSNTGCPDVRTISDHLHVRQYRHAYMVGLCLLILLHIICPTVEANLSILPSKGLRHGDWFSQGRHGDNVWCQPITWHSRFHNTSGMADRICPEPGLCLVPLTSETECPVNSCSPYTGHNISFEEVRNRRLRTHRSQKP